MSRDPTGIKAGSGLGEHATARDTARITYDRIRTARPDLSRSDARKIASQVARKTHTAKD